MRLVAEHMNGNDPAFSRHSDGTPHIDDGRADRIGVSALATQAAALWQQGRHEDAATLATYILSSAPREHSAVHLLGLIARQNGETARAIDFFRQAIAIDDQIAVYHGNLGNAYFESGQLGEAAGCFRQVLALEPGSAQAHFGLGLALMAQKVYDGAVDELEQAIKARPDHANAHLNLGIALTELGRLDKAVAHCRRAVALDPGYAGNHVSLGTALKANGDLLAARDQFARAIELDSKLADAHCQLGLTLSALDCPDEAVNALRQALVLRPNMPEALIALGDVTRILQQFDEATHCYERALSLRPQWIMALLGLARTLSSRGHFEEARASFLRALECHLELADAHFEIGLRYQHEGRFDEAIFWYEKALAIQSDHIEANYNLAMIGKSNARDIRIKNLETFLTSRPLAAEQRARLNFALGKSYDDNAEYDTAFRYFKAGNEILKTEYRHQYSPEGFTSAIDQQIAIFGKDFFFEKGRIGSESEVPVFIVGVTRSGTTLAEQIMASHPRVCGRGELDFIRQISLALPEWLGSADPYPACASAIDGKAALRIAEKYLAQISNDAVQAERIVDKRPGNFLRLGLIALLFPRARLIHCVRDPIDTCLSCYFLYNKQAPFTHDLEYLGRYYRDYQRLMSHWHEILPSRILDVPYEALVRDPEAWSRKLVDFLGLPWDERCLTFYETKRSIYTPSFHQVRQPVYGSSVGRWRHYAKHLGPLFSALGIVSPSNYSAAAQELEAAAKARPDHADTHLNLGIALTELGRFDEAVVSCW